MFNNTKNDQKGKANGVTPTSSSSSSNSLVQGTNIEGTINADKDIRIDGSLKGNLICKGKVIIGPTGYISGDVQCENAVIEGRFEGLIIVGDVLHVKETARVDGDVTTQKLVVQPGSIFNVKCKMGPPGNLNSKKISSDEKEAVDLNSLSKTKATMS
ncbi:MAG: polymer-forming cytoskeletal protein [Bacteroidota bacterium]|nr:polymer-forming cytoskeletal protein [Bacteroidota bacterium]